MRIKTPNRYGNKEASIGAFHMKVKPGDDYRAEILVRTKGRYRLFLTVESTHDNNVALTFNKRGNPIDLSFLERDTSSSTFDGGNTKETKIEINNLDSIIQAEAKLLSNF